MTTGHRENVCLCCGQLRYRRKEPLTQAEMEPNWVLLDALGYTREKLLREHRAQLDYQLPGLAAWLEGQ